MGASSPSLSALIWPDVAAVRVLVCGTLRGCIKNFCKISGLRMVRYCDA